MCICPWLKKFLLIIFKFLAKAPAICEKINCNCVVCNNMAQAQIQMDLEGKIEKGDKKKNFLQRNKRAVTVRKAFANVPASCHTLPLVVKIQSTPLDEALNTQVLLDDDWTMFVGGAEGQSFLRTHLNIRRRVHDGGMDFPGVAIPIAMIDCVKEALQTITENYKLFNSTPVNK